MTDKGGMYAEVGGVDYTLLQGFKNKMVAVGRSTLRFAPKGFKIIPLAHGVYIQLPGSEVGTVMTLEGLGNKDWIAEWMYAEDPEGGSRYGLIAEDLIMMALNDNVAHGADPFHLSDEVAAKTSEWFADSVRSQEFADGVFQVCKRERLVLGSGESPAYKFLLGAMPPVADAPTMTSHITGYVKPSRLVKCTGIRAGDVIIGAKSSGVHSNGISMIIGKASKLPDQFKTRLPSGQMLGDAVLTPTMSYSRLVRAVMNTGVKVHAFLPMTGDGAAKLAFDKKPLTYVVDKWPTLDEVPEIFRFMSDAFGIPLEDFLTTFNGGIGYAIYVAKSWVDAVLEAAEKAGYEAMVIGHVAAGKRGTVFGPADDLWLAPPGE